MILVFKKTLNLSSLYISKSDSQKPGPKAPHCQNIMILIKCFGACNIFFTAVIQYVQYFPRLWEERSRVTTNCAGQSNIFYTSCSIREVLLRLSTDRKQNKNHISYS